MPTSVIGKEGGRGFQEQTEPPKGRGTQGGTCNLGGHPGAGEEVQPSGLF